MRTSVHIPSSDANVGPTCVLLLIKYYIQYLCLQENINYLSFIYIYLAKTKMCLVDRYCLTLYSESDSETNTKTLWHTQHSQVSKEGLKNRQTHRNAYRRVAIIWFMLALMEQHHLHQQPRISVGFWCTLNIHTQTRGRLYLLPYPGLRKALPTPMGLSHSTGPW